MPAKYQPFIEWLINNGLIIGGSLVAFFMSVFTTKQHGRIDWVEACLCALIALGVNSLLGFLGLPQQLALLVGVFIGSVGSQWVRKNMLRQAELRIGNDLDAVKADIEQLKKSHTGTFKAVNDEDGS